MRVWTIQPSSVLGEIEKTGTYRCQEERSYNLSKKNSLREKYQWLIDRMEMRIGERPEGVKYPIWAWHTWDFERRCPDKDSAAFLERTEDKVLLTLEVPESEIVLTDFDAWQIVMNNGYLTNEIDEEKLEEIEAELDQLDDAALEQKIAESWENVFAIRKMDTEDLQRGRYVQGTFWELKKRYIVTTEILPAHA